MEPGLKAQLDRIFFPRAVAIIGASTRPGNFGMRFLQGIVNIGHPCVYPVHPEARELLGLQVYPSVLDIPAEVDLAIVATPPQAVPAVIRECADKGIQGVHIYSSGFGEIGEEGRRLQEEIVRLARNKGTRLIGPNCMGITNPEGKLIGTGVAKIGGSVAMLSQSGFMVGVMSRAISERGVGLKYMVSYGNACDLGAADFLEYFGEDPQIKIIVAYLEGISDGRRLYQAAREVSLKKRKPIIAIRGGTTIAGTRATASHTGSLAGSEAAWRALIAQTGVVEVKSRDELLDCVFAFHCLPLPRGRRVAVVSTGGGYGVLAADACAQAGLELIQIPPGTQSRLAKVQPSVGTSNSNPVDVGQWIATNPNVYADVVKVLEEEDLVDMFLVVGTSVKAMPEALYSTIARAGKPATLVFSQQGASPSDDFWREGFLAFQDVRRAANALGRLQQYAEFLKWASG
ncbi:MAG: CoA-binding protein [Chloroflexi bacterium]|nr:CoA-binding protein [Chloroflexota bacterium]